jgi:hypothetical protein
MLWGGGQWHLSPFCIWGIAGEEEDLCFYITTKPKEFSLFVIKILDVSFLSSGLLVLGQSVWVR